MVTPSVAKELERLLGIEIVDKAAADAEPSEDALALLKKFGLLEEDDGDAATQEPADTT